MTKLILTLFTLLSSLILLKVTLGKKVNFFVALHLYLFLLIFFVYQLISSFIIDPQFDWNLLLLVTILLLFYIIIFLFLSSTILIRKSLISHDKLFLIVKELTNKRFLFSIIIISIFFKLYLLFHYGIFYKKVYFREVLGVPYYIEVIDMLLAYPTIGAFLVYLISLIIKVDVSRLIKFFISGLCIFFYLFYFYFFEFAGGVRRYTIFLAIIILLTMAYSKEYKKWGIKFYLTGILILFITGLISTQYIKTRGVEYKVHNLSEYFAISKEKTANIKENIEQREGCLLLLYNIIKAQVSDRKTANSLLISQAIRNAMPRFLRPQVVNLDEIVVSAYDLPLIYDPNDVDIATNILSILQSDLFLAAYFTLPLVYLMLMIFYSRMVLHYYKKSIFISLCGISFIFLTAFHIEESLEIFFIDFRNSLVLLSIGYLLLGIKIILKKGTSKSVSIRT